MKARGWTLARRWLLCAAAISLAGATQAQHLFKCDSVFQDRPCESKEVQQRFSHATGSFSVSQVNADTDKDCARAAAEIFPFWERMNAGESLESVKAGIDARPISRAEKSQIRDALLVLREFKGSPKEVRSQLERNCMNYKRARGVATLEPIQVEPMKARKPVRTPVRP